MTSLTFGNHLKFGQDSCHTSKGRQLPSSTERESTQSSVQTTPLLRGASNEPRVDVVMYDAMFIARLRLPLTEQHHQLANYLDLSIS